MLVDPLCLLSDVEERHGKRDLQKLLPRGKRKRRVAVEAGARKRLGAEHRDVSRTNHRALRVVDRSNHSGEKLEAHPNEHLGALEIRVRAGEWWAPPRGITIEELDPVARRRRIGVPVPVQLSADEMNQGRARVWVGGRVDGMPVSCVGRKVATANYLSWSQCEPLTEKSLPVLTVAAGHASHLRNVKKRAANKQAGETRTFPHDR